MRRSVWLGGLYVLLAALKSVLILRILGIASSPYFYPSIFQLLMHLSLLSGFYLLGFRKRLLIFWGGQGIYFLILLGYHVIYHRIFNVFLDYHVAGAGLDIVFKGFLPLTAAMLLVLIDLPALLGLVFLSPVVGRKENPQRLAGAARLFSALLLFCLALPEGSDWGALSWSLRKARASEPPVVLSGAVGDELFSGDKKEDSTPVPESETVLLEGGETPVPDYPPFEGILSGLELPESPNFLLIQFESLQTGLPELTHNGQPVMPYLNRLTEESIYFPYCFAYHRKGGSSDCEIAIFDNMDPGDRMLMTSTRYPHDRSFLKQMKPLGYEFYGFHDYVKDFYNRADSYSRIGFDGFFDYYDMKMGPPKWAARDGEMFDFIASQNPPESPVLSYVITVSSHVGYNHIITYHENPLFDDVARKRDRHAMLCFNYTDRELERFIDEIRKKYPNLYIFIYGDHSTPTVSFDGDLEPAFYTRGEAVMEFVPLFILPPRELGIEGRTYPDVLVSFLDIAPTILEMAGVEGPGADGNLNAAGETLYGGSLLSSDISRLPIPYDEKTLDRRDLLSEIRSLIPLETRL